MNEAHQSSIGRSQLELTSRLRKMRSRPSLRMRWAVLGTVSVVMIGSYYSMDIPAALHQQLRNFMPPSTRFEYYFNLLFTLYSLPNIVLPFIGGTLVDKYSAPTCLVIFSFLLLIGQIVFAIGTSFQSWNLMLIGRIIYGFGGENICVAQSAFLAVWFAGKELAFSLGISLSLARMGSVLNNVTSPVLANKFSLPAATSFGMIINFISVATAVASFFLDRKGEMKCKRSNDARVKLTESLLEGREEIDDEAIPTISDIVENRGGVPANPPVSFRDIRNFGPVFWFLSLSCFVVYGCVLPFNNVASGILLERNFFIDSKQTGCSLMHTDQCTSGTLQPGANYAVDEKGNRCQIKEYEMPLLPSSLNITKHNKNKSWEMKQYVFKNISATDVNCIDPFWADACTKDFCDAQKRATEAAGKYMSIPYFMSVILSPLLGHLVDVVGLRAFFACLAPVFLVFVHATMAVGSKSPLLPLIGQGVAYALFAAVIWPSVPLTVDERFTGTAFGVITGIQNIGLSVIPLIVAAIYRVDDKYIPGVEYFFVACASLGVIAGICLNIVDWKTGGYLNNTKRAKEEHISEDNQEQAGYISSLVPSSEYTYI